MPAELLPVDLDRTLPEVDEWLADFISKSHPDLGRPGPVCPFVEPSRKAASLETRVRLVGERPSLALLYEMVRCGLDEFEAFPWRVSNPNLRSMLLVFPDVTEQNMTLLDEAFGLLKDECVHRGLMIAQFHPLCTVPAARNPMFEVSRAPVPVLAIRLMAVHDVLFLGHRKDWFQEYMRRFGDKYTSTPASLDPAFYSAYLAARAAHGT